MPCVLSLTFAGRTSETNSMCGRLDGIAERDRLGFAVGAGGRVDSYARADTLAAMASMSKSLAGGGITAVRI